MDKLGDGIPLGDASQTIGGKKRRWAPPERHQWFDPWKIANGNNLKALVNSTVISAQCHEAETKAALGRGEKRTTGTTSGGSRRSPAISLMPC
jgi:hypothetical protein